MTPCALLRVDNGSASLPPRQRAVRPVHFRACSLQATALMGRGVAAGIAEDRSWRTRDRSRPLLTTCSRYNSHRHECHRRECHSSRQLSSCHVVGVGRAPEFTKTCEQGGQVREGSGRAARIIDVSNSLDRAQHASLLSGGASASHDRAGQCRPRHAAKLPAHETLRLERRSGAHDGRRLCPARLDERADGASCWS